MNTVNILVRYPTMNNLVISQSCSDLYMANSLVNILVRYPMLNILAIAQFGNEISLIATNLVT